MPDSPKQLGQVQARGEGLELAKTIPYWLVAIVGLIYASGFLVVTTHLERFGIRVEGTDVWKTRYIHIGVLAMCFPVMIVGTAFGMWYLLTIREMECAEQEKLLAARFAVRCLRPNDLGTQQSEKQRRHLRWLFALSGFVILLMELTFYAFAMFIRRGNSPDPASTRWKLVGMLVAGFVLLILAARIEKWGSGSRWPGILTRCCALIAVLALAGWAAGPYWSWSLIWGFLQTRGAACAMMVCFLGFIGYIVFSLKRNQAKYSQARWRAAWLITICIGGPMYYLSLVGFAHSVFAYIPAARDGGDYTVSWMVRISRKDNAKGGNECPKWQRLVEETSTALYVADGPDRQPCEWRSKPEEIPNLHSISRDQIADIEYKFEPLDCDPEKGPEQSPRPARPGVMRSPAVDSPRPRARLNKP
jgi:hypothetical protein